MGKYKKRILALLSLLMCAMGGVSTSATQVSTSQEPEDLQSDEENFSDEEANAEDEDEDENDKNIDTEASEEDIEESEKKGLSTGTKVVGGVLGVGGLAGMAYTLATKLSGKDITQDEFNTLNNNTLASMDNSTASPVPILATDDIAGSKGKFKYAMKFTNGNIFVYTAKGTALICGMKSMSGGAAPEFKIRKLNKFANYNGKELTQEQIAELNGGSLDAPAEASGDNNTGGAQGGSVPGLGSDSQGNQQFMESNNLLHGHILVGPGIQIKDSNDLINDKDSEIDVEDELERMQTSIQHDLLNNEQVLALSNLLKSSSEQGYKGSVKPQGEKENFAEFKVDFACITDSSEDATSILVATKNNCALYKIVNKSDEDIVKKGLTVTTSGESNINNEITNKISLVNKADNKNNVQISSLALGRAFYDNEVKKETFSSKARLKIAQSLLNNSRKMDQVKLDLRCEKIDRLEKDIKSYDNELNKKTVLINKLSAALSDVEDAINPSIRAKNSNFIPVSIPMKSFSGEVCEYLRESSSGTKKVSYSKTTQALNLSTFSDDALKGTISKVVECYNNTCEMSLQEALKLADCIRKHISIIDSLNKVSSDKLVKTRKKIEVNYKNLLKLRDKLKGIEMNLLNQAKSVDDELTAMKDVKSNTTQAQTTTSGSKGKILVPQTSSNSPASGVPSVSQELSNNDKDIHLLQKILEAPITEFGNYFNSALDLCSENVADQLRKLDLTDVKHAKSEVEKCLKQISTNGPQDKQQELNLNFDSLDDQFNTSLQNIKTDNLKKKHENVQKKLKANINLQHKLNTRLQNVSNIVIIPQELKDELKKDLSRPQQTIRKKYHHVSEQSKNIKQPSGLSMQRIDLNFQPSFFSVPIEKYNAGQLDDILGSLVSNNKLETTKNSYSSLENLLSYDVPQNLKKNLKLMFNSFKGRNNSYLIVNLPSKFTYDGQSYLFIMYKNSCYKHVSSDDLLLELCSTFGWKWDNLFYSAGVFGENENAN